MVTNNNYQGDSNDQLIDIAEYAKNKLKIPDSGVIYFIEIEGHKYKVPRAKIHGKELLELAGKRPANDYYLLQMFADGSKKEIKPDDIVDLSTFGVEKFNVICKTNTDGLYGAKRDFALPAKDEKFLNSLGLQWETISSSGPQRLAIYKYPINEGYTVKEVDLVLFINPSYPEVQIDMAFFKPFLARLDGKPISATSPIQIGGENWQQWSRHRAANQWISGVDDIQTHLIYVNNFISAELLRG